MFRHFTFTEHNSTLSVCHSRDISSIGSWHGSHADLQGCNRKLETSVSSGFADNMASDSWLAVTTGGSAPWRTVTEVSTAPRKVQVIRDYIYSSGWFVGRKARSCRSCRCKTAHLSLLRLPPLHAGWDLLRNCLASCWVVASVAKFTQRQSLWIYY